MIISKNVPKKPNFCEISKFESLTSFKGLLHSTIGVTSTSQPQNNLYFMKNCPSVAIKSLITNENMDSVSCHTFYINEYMPFKMIKSNKLSGNLEILMVEIILVKMKIFLLDSYEPSSRTFFSSIE